MTFDEVDSARRVFAEKKHKLWQKAFRIYGALIVIGLIIWISVVASRVVSFAPIGESMFAWMVTIFMGLVMSSVFYFLIATIIIMNKSKNEELAYDKAYRTYFVEKVMASSFTDLYYCHEEGMPKATLVKTLMVNTGDSYRSNDFTRGKYKNVSFSQADVHIQERHEDSDGDTYYVTIFRGRFMIFEFPKKFQKRLLVAGLKSGVASVSRNTNFKRIETESSEFNRRFKIRAEDGFEMFYLLDPAMMTRMEEIEDAYNDTVMFGFYDNKLLIGINDGKDSFEPPHSNKPLDEKTELDKNLADVRVITDLIDNLRLSRV